MPGCHLSDRELRLIRRYAHAGYSLRQIAHFINLATGESRTDNTILRACRQLGVTTRGRPGAPLNNQNGRSAYFRPGHTPASVTRGCPFYGCGWTGTDDTYYDHWRSVHRTRAGDGATGASMR